METLQNAYHTLKCFSQDTFSKKSDSIFSPFMSPVNLTSTWTIRLNLKKDKTLSSLTWETLAQKHIKKQKSHVFRLKALFLLKNMFCFYFSAIAKLWPRKKVIFEVFIFWRYSKTLMLKIMNVYSRKVTLFITKVRVKFFQNILLVPEADSGLVKLVLMTNVFFNNQQYEIKIKRFMFVKQIKPSFFSNSWNQFYSWYVPNVKTGLNKKLYFSQNFVAQRLK